MSKTYTKLAVSVPPEVANERMNAFFTELGALREKHGLPDMHVIVRQNIEVLDGESHGLCTIHYGDQSHAVQMVSYAMGHAVGEHQKFTLAARSDGIRVGAKIAMQAAQKHHDDMMEDF